MDTRECVSCWEEDVRAISKEECETRCTNSSGMIREYVDGECRFACSGHGTKKDGVCTCHPGWFGETCSSQCDGFKALTGKCHSCAESIAVSSKEEECNRCAKRSYYSDACQPECEGFRDTGHVCYPCDDDSHPETKAAECAKCGDAREYIGAYARCYPKCEEGFIGKDHFCHKCDTSATPETTKEQCGKCPGRSYVDGLCYPICLGFQDVSNACHACTETAGFESTYAECEKCPAARNIIEKIVNKVTGEKKFYCALKTCGEGFRSSGEGSCYACDTKDSPWTTKAECERCSSREYFNGRCYTHCEGFRDNTGECHPCNEKAAVANSSVEECNKCSKRAYFGDACQPECNGFRNSSYTCMSCSTESHPTTSTEECEKCGTDREYFNGACYKSCSGFLANDGACHICTTAESLATTEEQCSQCSAERVYESGICYKKCVGFKSVAGTCYSCAESASIEVSSYTECERNCTVARELVVRGSKMYCELNSTSCTGFKDLYGNCHACSTTSSPNALKAECDKCTSPARDYREDAKCYPRCDGFWSTANVCYSCSTSAAVSGVRLTECEKCTSPARDYIGSTATCYPHCDGFRDNNHTCYACTTSGSIENVTRTECDKCGTARTYVTSGSKCKLKT